MALRLWSGAASDCEVFEAGDRFGTVFFTWPAFALALWAVLTVTVILFRRRSLAFGLIVGVLLTLGIAYWFVAGTAGMIRSHADLSADFCPTGVPDWWPGWLPQ